MSDRKVIDSKPLPHFREIKLAGRAVKHLAMIILALSRPPGHQILLRHIERVAFLPSTIFQCDMRLEWWPRRC